MFSNTSIPAQDEGTISFSTFPGLQSGMLTAAPLQREPTSLIETVPSFLSSSTSCETVALSCLRMGMPPYVVFSRTQRPNAGGFLRVQDGVACGAEGGSVLSAHRPGQPNTARARAAPLFCSPGPPLSHVRAFRLSQGSNPRRSSPSYLTRQPVVRRSLASSGPLVRGTEARLRVSVIVSVSVPFP